MNTTQAVANLQAFVRLLVAAGVKSAPEWHEWRKQDGNEQQVATLFCYDKQKGMPSITSLVTPFFHPTLALIGLNYTQTAHMTLHRFKTGWTDALRLCRGIVFDRDARLVAFPFPKFFNYGEHEETSGELPDGPFEAMVKEDGHLAIIFQYRGKLIATTRGSFVSPSGKAANRMLATQSRKNWAKKIGPNQTLLAEIIHPCTHVILDYGRRRGFVILACYDNHTYQDRPHTALIELGKALKAPVAELCPFASIAEVKARVAENQFQNREGYVVRLANGMRVKFKFQGYLGRMLTGKLTYRYVMNRLIAGDLEKTLAGKEAEIEQGVRRMAAELLKVNEYTDVKARREYLRGLRMPGEALTQTHIGACGKFNTWAKTQQPK